MTPPNTDSSALTPLEVHVFAGGAFAENTYLVRCARTNHAAIIDPGAATPAALAAARGVGATIDAVYLTHAHVDHVEGIPLVRADTDAPIWLHPADLPLYEWAEERAGDFGIRLAGPLPPPERQLVPGESVPIGDHRLEVRFTPGHAPGHVIFVAADAGFSLVGDVIFFRSIGRTDLPGGDLQQLMASIRSEVLTLPDETRLLNGHGRETTVGSERLGNPFLISQAAGRFA